MFVLRFPGSSTTLCDGLTRRDLLHVGGLGAFGLTLSSFLRLKAASPTSQRGLAKDSNFGRAKACILLFPYGSPPQHETFDPKPDAPPEIQGELKSIPTNVTGVRIGEGLPQIAKVMDRVTVVRSVTHPYPEHGVAYAVSGIPTYTPALETLPRDPRHWPFIGSIVDYLETKRTGNPVPEVPRNIGLPWLLNSRTDLNVSAGPYAAFLGQGFDPVWAEFDGEGKKIAPKYTDGQTKEFMDPFALCSLDSKFRLSTTGELPAEVSATRFEDRRSLLARFDAARLESDRIGSAGGFDKFREMAFSLVASNRMRQALDITRESLPVRTRYGPTLFGQSCLCARRLVEAGSKFVTVFWDGFGQFGNCGWDTHNNHYPRLKEYLLPGFDQAYPALLLDLEARGLLDETLVIWMSEHGRTPKIDSKPKGAGRHHWSRAYSVVMAGGGIARGKIVGSTDKIGGDVRDVPVSPKDILATALHLLGIDPHTMVPDQQGRPVPAVGEGKVRPEVFA
ncbi:MAG: DUF1501 domain-containing protein [Planctomycetes bacterium]|nr:DUF1501 domain-containing protein [Planctomycetota bacterium]